LYIGKVNPAFLWLTPIRKKYKIKDAKRNDYLPSSSIITKLANGLKRWQSLKDPDPRKRLRHKAAPAIYSVSFCAHSALMAGCRSKLEAIPLSGIER